MNVPPTTTASPPRAGAAAAARRPRMLDGLLTGTAAAGVGGLLWWAVATTTEFAYWQALSAIAGIVIGYGVLLGTRRGGGGPAALAAVLGALTVPVAVYFIDRTFTIRALQDDGQLTDLPLWQGFGAAGDVIRAWVDFQASRALGWLLAPVVAAAIAGAGRNR